MNALPVYRVEILPHWIDYNGHLRDAYYVVALSGAIDDMMDHLGLDAEYRERTGCTLYTLEAHMHYLREVKASDRLAIETSILDADTKRIHAGCKFTCGLEGGAVASGEAMLMHVQQGEPPASAPFPADIARSLASLKLSGAARDTWGPGSRKMEIKRPDDRHS